MSPHNPRCPAARDGDQPCDCYTIRPPAPLERTKGPDAPTRPVRDPNQCARCGLIHMSGVCPVVRPGVAFSLAEGYHKTPSGEATTGVGTIGHGHPSPVSNGAYRLATGVHLVDGQEVKHHHTRGRLLGVYPTPAGEWWALVAWELGSPGLIEPEKLRPSPAAVAVERPRCVVIGGVRYPLNTVADASAARNAFQLAKSPRDSARIRILYSDTGEAVEGLFGVFIAE